MQLAWCKKYRWEIGLYLCFLILFGLMLPGKRAPIVYPDEAGYIGWARLFAGQKGDGLIYFPFYGLLLAPVAALFPNLLSLYPAILAVNGILCSFLPVGLYRLGEDLFPDRRLRGLAAAAVALYPSYFMYTHLALCENVLSVGLVFLALAIRRMIRTGKYGWMLFLLMVLPLTHPRAFVLLPAAAVIVWLQRPGVWRKWMIRAAVALFLAGTAYTFFDQSSVNTAHLREQLAHLCSGSGVYALVTVWISQQLYLIFSSFGFYLVGWWYGLRRIVRKEEGWQVSLFLLVAAGLTGILSAVYLSHHEKPVHLFYGRYNDYAVSGVILLGLAGWCRHKLPKWLGLFWIGFTGVAKGCYGEELTRIGEGINNAIGVFSYRLVLREFDVTLAAIFFFGLGILVMLAGVKRKEIGCLVLCGIYLGTGIFIDQVHFEGDSRYGAPDHVRVVQAVSPKAEVLMEGDFNRFWLFPASTVYAPEIRLSTQPAGQRYLLTRRFDETLPLISTERRGVLYLYAADEETAAQYEERGMLLSRQETFSGQITLVSSTQEQVRVALTNTGDPWLCLAGIRDASRAVRLGIRVLDQETGETLQVLRCDLPQNVRKGETVEITLPRYPLMYLELVRDFSSAEFTEGALLLRDGREEFSQKLPEEESIWFSMLTYFEEGVNQLVGFNREYTGPDSGLENIVLSTQGAAKLRVETEGAASFRLWADGQELPLAEQGEGYTDFWLDGQEEVHSLRFQSVCHNPFRESGLPGWLSFLSIDSRILPATHFAAAHPKWNNHDYGFALKRIYAVH